MHAGSLQFKGARDMKTQLLAAVTLGLSGVAAHSAGLDRSGRPTGLIFETGNVVELSFGFADPSIEGTDIAGSPTGNIADSFSLVGGGIRYELNDKLSIGLLIDEPFGADITYGPSSPVLAGTGADVSSAAYTGFARYRFNENWAVHGGIVYQDIEANVPLAGAAYLQRDPATGAVIGNGLNGYNANFSSDSALGYLVGASFEIPDIALRVALTYHSEIDHDLSTTETINGGLIAQSNTAVTTPEAIELAFQSGVAQDTLVFGSVRFSHNSQTTVSPVGLRVASNNPNASLTDLENAWEVELGVGRRFNDKWSGSATIGWEQSGEDDFVSPLSGTNGATYLALGASYQFTESTKISGGVRYTRLRDATGTVGGVPVASFDGSSAISAGLRIQYKF